MTPDELKVIIMATWLVAALVVMATLRVHRASALRQAPTRSGTLSLPVVGAVILSYLLLAPAALLIAAAIGWVQMPGGLAQTQASQPAASAAALVAEEAAAGRGDMFKLQSIDAVVKMVIIAGTLVLVSKLFERRSRGWGVHLTQVPGGLWRGALAFFCIFPLLMAAYVVTDALLKSQGQEMTIHPVLKYLQAGPPLVEVLLFAVYTIAITPVAEELAFRGLLQTALIQRGGGFLIPQWLPPSQASRDWRPLPFQRWLAIGVTSVVFSLAHAGDHFAVIFLLSVALGYVYERTGNLWAAVVLHGGFNAVSVLPMLYQSLGE